MVDDAIQLRSCYDGLPEGLIVASRVVRISNSRAVQRRVEANLDKTPVLTKPLF